MSAELDALVDQMLPRQREIWEAYIAAGPGARIYWQGGRAGGKWVIQKAIELKLEEERDE